MGLAVRGIVNNMPHKLRKYHQRRQVQRMDAAAKAGASWAYRTVQGEGSRIRIACASRRQAEAWSRRQIEERCDAYLAGLYN